MVTVCKLYLKMSNVHLFYVKCTHKSKRNEDLCLLPTMSRVGLFLIDKNGKEPTIAINRF